MDPLTTYDNAIAAVESAGSGGFGAKGPWVQARDGSLDRAYGRHQVMGKNIPNWTQGALGYSMTPSEFLQDPEAQTATFRHHFGQLVDHFGNPQDAASVWFTGRPQATGGNANDGYISGNEYVRRFNKALGTSDTSTEGSPATMADNGALSSPRGVLAGGPLSGMGPALQDAGAFLMNTSPYTKGTTTDHAANWLKEAGPQIIDGGTDPITGEKILYRLGPGGTLQPMTVAGAPAGGGAPGGAPTGRSGMPNVPQLTAALDQFHKGLINEAQLRETAGSMLSDYTDAMAKGDADPKNLGMRAGPLRPYSIMLAHALHPNMDFSEAMIDARRKEVSNQATSNNPATLSGANASFGKVLLHANEVQQASDELAKLQWASGAYNDLNKAQEVLKSHGGDTAFKTAMSKYSTSVDFFAREADRLMSGGRSTVSGREDVLKHFAGNLSPQERAAAVGQTIAMSHDVFNPLVYNNNMAFGRLGRPDEKKPEDFMSPEVRKAWADTQSRVHAAMFNTSGAKPSASDTRPPIASFDSVK